MSKDIDNYVQSDEKEFFEKKAEKEKKAAKTRTVLGLIILIALILYLLNNAGITSFAQIMKYIKPTQKSTTNIQKPIKPITETKVKIEPEVEIKVLQEDEENLIILNIDNDGRNTPFTPYKEKSLYIMNNIDEALLKGLPSPEDNLKVDESAKKLYELRISGLLYDKNKSSAIVNIEGKDYLVHKYDKLFGYKIINITKNHVEVKYGTNSYQLRIGEMISGNIIENNTYNINHKFAGKELPELENIKFLGEEE